MKTDTAVELINSVNPAEVERYARYLGGIVPTTNEELFRRWMFAYASVHTTWAMNCKLYRALAPLDWLGDHTRLLDRIESTGAGMHNNRAMYISEFSEFFWDHPNWFWKNELETWVAYRDRLREAAVGIGRAKSSFVVEMTYPVPAQVICTDTHVMQLYGRKPGDIGQGRVSDTEERKMEDHWVKTCGSRKLPPVLGRWIFWDRKQGHSDPRYWSFVFEKQNVYDQLDAAIKGVRT